VRRLRPMPHRVMRDVLSPQAFRSVCRFARRRLIRR
jgi:hypothetical protein